MTNEQLANRLMGQVQFNDALDETCRALMEEAADKLQGEPAASTPVTGDDVGLHVMTGVFDMHGTELRAGDRIVIRLNGEHTKPDYWNPEYLIEWKAPRFKLRHVGGGIGSDTATWYFGLGTQQGFEKLELLDRPAAFAQDRAAQGSGNLSDGIIKALDDLVEGADFLHLTGDRALSERIRSARDVLHAAILYTPPASASRSRPQRRRR